jgi:hypothetical protein
MLHGNVIGMKEACHNQSIVLACNESEATNPLCVLISRQFQISIVITLITSILFHRCCLVCSRCNFTMECVTRKCWFWLTHSTQSQIGFRNKTIAASVHQQPWRFRDVQHTMIQNPGRYIRARKP